MPRPPLPTLFDGFPADRPSQLPVIGEQKDIRYHATSARTLLNGPETTGMDFWSINPYTGCAFGCAYCYARYAHRYALDRAVSGDRADESLMRDIAAMPAWLTFERRIFVKENAATALRAQLRSLSRNPQRWAQLREDGIAIGTSTDPYQPAERRFRITRSILEVLAEYAGIPVSITTKSPLVTRDTALLQRIAECSPVRVHVSLITTDRDLARRIEPRSPTPESRLRAVARLRAAGIDAGMFVMPVLPGITDGPEALDALVRATAAAGATHLVAATLRLRASARQRYLPFIEQEFPDLAPRYRASYAGGYHVSQKYRDGLRAFVQGLCLKHGVQWGFGERREALADVVREAAGSEIGRATTVASAVAEQLGLAI